MQLRHQKHHLEYPVSYNLMEDELLTLSRESDHTSNVISVFRNIIPSFKSGILTASQVTSDYINGNIEVTNDLSRKQKNTIEESRRLDFINFSERKISIPENFTGSLLDYSSKLIIVTNQLYNIHITTLVEYNAILSSFLTNKADKVSIKSHHDQIGRAHV